MTKNSKNRIFLCLLLVIIFVCNNFAAILSDNDGSVFVTKAEFETLKKNFELQIKTYSDSIDGKIDGAIASYLAGIRLTTNGTLKHNAKKLEDIKWRDKLIKIGTARKWTSATAYTDTANYAWEADYDTVLKCGWSDVPTSATNADTCYLIWTANAPYGHGGLILSMKASFNGGGYWKRAKWGGYGNSYDSPNYPMIQYRKYKFNGSGMENEQKLLGWFDYGACFTNANSSECDTRPSPGSTQLVYTTTNGRPDGVNAFKYAADIGAGYDTNVWGIGIGSTAAAAAAGTAGFRPTKASTIFFPDHQDFGNGRNACRKSVTCNGHATLPLNKYFPLTTANEDQGLVTDDYLHTLMLGCDNTQEVNYYVSRDDLFFWGTRPDWPEECYKTFTLNNISLRKVGINQQPDESSGGSWSGNRKEDDITDASSSYVGMFKFTGVPSSLVVSIPTKPHKKLKLLDSNFISADGKRYLTFGEGVCLTDACPETATVTLKFDIITNPEFAANNCKATIELCDRNFNEATGRKYYDVETGATRLSDTSNKWKLDTTKTNKITFSVAKDKAVYMRFSPNDNSGKNYVNITNFVAEYTVE